MPKTAQFIIRWSPEQSAYRFFATENASPATFPSEDDLQTWLDTHHAFAFHGREGQINLLKEKRNRGRDGYWYAYRRHGKQMFKSYAGRSTQLSLERLEKIASHMTHEDAAQQEPSSPTQFEPLLIPKLQLPRHQQSLIRRERLLELLDKGLERKLTIISGPAGYGKTTLVGQWVADRSTRPEFPRVASVTLDEGDKDLVRFWRYIIAACQQFRQGLGQDALELLLENRLLPSKSPEIMLTALLNELSQLEHPALLILDDFHVIASPLVFEMLAFFLDHLPASLHLIMLMRGDPPFSLSRLRARNELVDIYPPHLAFTLEETRTFLAQEALPTLSPEILRQIHERMEAWPTGLRLFVSALGWRKSEQDIENVLAAFAGSHWSIQDYFVNEVLRALPAEQQEFLLQTSVLPRLTASLCNAITGRADSARLLDTLRWSDLFLIPLDDRSEWARYQSLFSSAMQVEARRRLGDERLRLLSAQASAWYERHGLLTEAIDTALDAAQWIHAADLIQQLMDSSQESNALSASEIYSLNRWSERLPREELERHPDLCVHYAMTLLFLLMGGSPLPDEKERIYHLLQVAERQWRDANNTAKLAEVFAFRALLARQEGKMLQAVTWARQSLAWLPPEDRAWRSLDLSVVGTSEIYDGTLDNAREFLHEATLLSEQQGNLTYARATRGMLAWVSFEQGELHHAAEQFRQMQAEARKYEDRDDIAHTQLALAQLAYQWNNLDEAEQAVHEALAIGEQMQLEEFLALATIRLSQIEHARGQSAQARQRLTSWLAQRQTPTSLNNYQLYRLAQAALVRIQLASGDLPSAERWFISIERREETLPLLQRQREQLLRARLLLAQRDTSAALDLLANLHAATLRTGHTLLALECQVIQVLAYAHQRSLEQARALLYDLLKTTQNENYHRLFLDEGEEMATLLRGPLLHLQEKALLAYARQLLGAFAYESSKPPLKITAQSAHLIEPLSPQEQKVLRLLAAGNSNAEIARELVVSVNTVRTQVQSIYRKLNVGNRVEASAVAKEMGVG